MQLLEELRTQGGRIMNLVRVPSEFRERVSDDGRQVFLASMQLASVPEWLGNLIALTELDLAEPTRVRAGVAREPDRPHHPGPEF